MVWERYCNNSVLLRKYGAELGAQEASTWCWFWQMTYPDFTLFYSFVTQANVFA